VDGGTPFRSGFATVLGLPNAGKSTLINSILGRSLCITSFLPQTTRYHLRCIATSERRQIVFVDTPGYVTRQNPVDRAMRREIYRGAEGVDVVLFVVDATRRNTDENREAWKALVSHSQASRVLVLNKVDRFAKVELIPMLEELAAEFAPDELVPVSAKKGTNLEELDRVITGLLPEGPRYYPGEAIVDRPLPFVLSEFIREQIHAMTREEVPFATAVLVERFQEEEAAGGSRAIDLAASILVERDSQKGILIGAGGATIKEIRERARRRILGFLGRGATVRLELAVKLKRKWRSDPEALRELGWE
jgi:GTP-binding protein Era